MVCLKSIVEDLIVTYLVDPIFREWSGNSVSMFILPQISMRIFLAASCGRVSWEPSIFKQLNVDLVDHVVIRARRASASVKTLSLNQDPASSNTISS